MELISQKMRSLAPELDPLRLGTGWKPEDLAKPQIIVESTFGDSHPGSGHLDKLVAAACEGVAQAGGHGARYFATDICDGESQGTDGINFSLASREMIANMIEIHANATPFDGGVYIASCDKGLPANLMGLARVNIPAVMITGGTMHAGPDLLTLEQLGMYSAKYERGEISEEKLDWAKQNACPSCGACSFIGTASTMQIMAEALGLALPGSALLPATSPDLVQYARRAGYQAVVLAKQGLKPSDIVTMDTLPFPGPQMLCCIFLRLPMNLVSRSMEILLIGCIVVQNICWTFVRQAVGPQNSSTMQAVYLPSWKKFVMCCIWMPSQLPERHWEKIWIN